jgi:hypothetical protein
MIFFATVFERWFVVRQVASQVIGVFEGFLQQLAGMHVVQRVEHEIAFAPLANDTGQPELGQMLRHGRRLSADYFGQAGNRLLALRQS